MKWTSRTAAAYLIVLTVACRGEEPARTAAPQTGADPALSQARERLMKEDWRGAAPLFAQALKANPNSDEAKFGLGTAYMNLNRYGEAISLFEDLLKRNPDSTNLKNNLAWIYATAKDPAARNPRKAVELARDAVLYAPADYNGWHTLAEAHLAAGQQDRALRAGRIALQMSQLAGVTNVTVYQELIDRCENASPPASSAGKTEPQPAAEKR